MSIRIQCLFVCLCVPVSSYPVIIHEYVLHSGSSLSVLKYETHPDNILKGLVWRFYDACDNFVCAPVSVHINTEASTLGTLGVLFDPESYTTFTILSFSTMLPSEEAPNPPLKQPKIMLFRNLARPLKTSTLKVQRQKKGKKALGVTPPLNRRVLKKPQKRVSVRARPQEKE